MATTQTFSDGSSIVTYDDGSTLITDAEGNVSSTPSSLSTKPDSFGYELSGRTK